MANSFYVLFFFGIVCGTEIPAQTVLQVNEDIAVPSTSYPLLSARDEVYIKLICASSNPDLAYYIKNRIYWDLIKSDGTILNITEAFYPTETAQPYFSNGHYTLKYSVSKDDGSYLFVLNIRGVTHADGGVYRCSIVEDRHGEKVLVDTKDVKVTVLHPVEKLYLDIYVDDGTTITLDGPSHVTLQPGSYKVVCRAEGSNPVPRMSLFLNQRYVQPMIPTSVEVNKTSGRVKTKAILRQNVTLEADPEPQILSCRASVHDGYYGTKGELQLLVEETGQGEQEPVHDTLEAGQSTSEGSEAINGTESGNVNMMGVLLEQNEILNNILEQQTIMNQHLAKLLPVNEENKATN